MWPFWKQGYCRNYQVRMRSYWIWVDLNLMTGTLLRREEFGERHSGRAPHNDGGKDSSDVSTSQAMWRFPAPQNLGERHRTDFLSVLPEEIYLPTPRFHTSDFQNYKRIHSCWFKLPSYNSPRKLIQTLIFLTHGLASSNTQWDNLPLTQTIEANSSQICPRNCEHSLEIPIGHYLVCP